MMGARYEFRDTAGLVLDGFSVGVMFPGITALPNIRLFNIGDDIDASLRFTVACLDWNYTGARDNQGRPVVAGKWLEGRIGAGSWTPVGGDPLVPGNFLALTPPAPENFVEIELRLNVPAGTPTGGMIGFIPEVAANVA